MLHDVSIDHSIGCRSCLFQTDRGQMQELCDDLRGHGFDVLALALGQPAASLQELAVADLLRERAERRDRRDDVERGLPFSEAVGLSGYELLGARRFAT